jgi:hypothetical protein
LNEDCKQLKFHLDDGTTRPYCQWIKDTDDCCSAMDVLDINSCGRCPADNEYTTGKTYTYTESINWWNSQIQRRLSNDT